jgi:Bacterial regulatory proteins, gntR family
MTSASAARPDPMGDTPKGPGPLPAALQALIDAYADGSSPEQIASSLPVTVQDVRAMLRSYGVQLRPQDQTRRPGPKPGTAQRTVPAARPRQDDPVPPRPEDAACTEEQLGDSDPRAYIQIARRVARQIQDGTLAIGSPAPSITVLAQETGHSRITCGKALRRLEDNGLLTRYPGLGYYVTGSATGSSGHQATAVPADRPPDAQIPAGHQAPPAPEPQQQVAGPAGRAPRNEPAETPGQPPQVIFQPPAPAQQPTAHSPVVAPDQATGQKPDVPLENVFELAGAWPSGEDHLCWLVSPLDKASASAAETLLMRYRELTGSGCLTPVPPRWLHIAVGHAGLAGELTAHEQARLISIVREQAGRLPAFTVTAGPAEVTARGVVCRAQPQGPLRRLEDLTADALTSTGYHCPVPPTVLTVPHMVLAYAAHDGTTGPLDKQLSVIPGMQVKIRVCELRLVQVRHNGCQITWRPVETIPLGNPRTRKPQRAQTAAAKTSQPTGQTAARTGRR